MCCRYVLLQEHTKTLLEKLGVLLEAGALSPTRYNIAPGGRIPVIRGKVEPVVPNALSERTRELVPLHWGLTPSWARDAANPVVNARAESLAEKPTFRDALRLRRCLIPASGFYEWKTLGRTRQPWLFRLCDEQPFALAGLWETWRSPDGAVLESCAIITTAPNALMTPIHHRMPAILADPAAWDTWLDSRIGSIDTLTPLLHPFPAGAMTAVAVSSRVNNTRHDAPDCLAPEGNTGEPQLSLGL